MGALPKRNRPSTGVAVLVGAAIGFAVVSVYLCAGLLVADWSISDFLAHLSMSSVGHLVGTIALAVAVVGLPIAGFLRLDLTAPLVVLMLVILEWLTTGAVQGLLSLQTMFGLALYAVLLSPIYLVLYGILGGSEYLFRTRATGQ